MRRIASLGVSAAVAAVVTHGTVYSGFYFNEYDPSSSYQGFFRQVLLATERLWSFANGWQPLSHFQDFGQFVAPAVHLVYPLIGFALFLALARHRPGSNIWKPAVVLVLLMTLPNTTPWVEALRSVLAVGLMAWSSLGGRLWRAAAQA